MAQFYNFLNYINKKNIIIISILLFTILILIYTCIYNYRYKEKF